MRNRTNATAVIRIFHTNRSLLVTWKPTTNKLQKVRLLAQPVEKTFITGPLSTLMSAPLINNKQITVNAALRLEMTHQLRKNSRGRTKQVQVQLHQNYQPLLNLFLKHPLQLQVPVGKRIQFLSLQIFFQALTKMLLRRTGNTGPRSVPDLAATTVLKTGTIRPKFSGPRWWTTSTHPASANNWAASSLISLLSKLTSLLVLFCVIQKLGPYSTITPLRTIIWCWNSRFWSPIKMI